MNATVDWLMAGDPVIRWHTMRDLLDLPESEWEKERQRTIAEGWVSQLLTRQGPDGTWQRGRWTQDVWTLCILVECGTPSEHPGIAPSVERSLQELFPQLDPAFLFKAIDMCHLGFWLRIGSYFLKEDEWMRNLVEALLSFQMDDGGWNCRIRNTPKTTHSSFHTTFNVLEGLKVAAEKGYVDSQTFKKSESQALEFMLAHRMFKSDQTGEIVHEKFLNLTFPSYWHYNVLRGLDYMRTTPQIADGRLEDAFAYLEGRRNSDGRWPVEKRIPGVTFFDMEPMGKPSRWNTLRTLRILKARNRTPLD